LERLPAATSRSAAQQRGGQRRDQGEQQHTRVGDTGAGSSLFVDSSVPAETKVYYAVTAIDAAGNESELSREATTRH
ncbi:MAG: hypothetical protein ABR512_06965, partial [Desulfopila sp.]